MPYLSACLDAICAQDLEEWEAIIVDDHSADDSVQCLEAYARSDKRLRYFSNPGNGIIDALRAAYLHTSGQFITRMDADDIMAPHRLSHMVDQLHQYGTGHVTTGLVRYFNENGLGDGYKKYACWLNALTRQGHNFKDIYKECPIPSPCWMLHRSDFDDVGGFDSDRYPEDYDLAFRMYEAGLRVIPSDQLLHHWRDYTDRTSRTHEHYADNRFLELKVHYFLKIDLQQDQPLILWGAGKKGKSIAQLLIQHEVDFTWMTNNPKKIGVDIYGKKLDHSSRLVDFNNPQIIVAVAGSAQEDILKRLKHQNAFLFC